MTLEPGSKPKTCFAAAINITNVDTLTEMNEKFSQMPIRFLGGWETVVCLSTCFLTRLTLHSGYEYIGSKVTILQQKTGPAGQYRALQGGMLNSTVIQWDQENYHNVSESNFSPEPVMSNELRLCGKKAKLQKCSQSPVCSLVLVCINTVSPTWTGQRHHFVIEAELTARHSLSQSNRREDSCVLAVLLKKPIIRCHPRTLASP